MSEIISAKSYVLTVEMNNIYKIDTGFNSKALSSPYSYSELNTMSYNTLNSKKYNNILFAHAKSYIDLNIPLNKNI